jgi:hypothetical protein
MLRVHARQFGGPSVYCNIEHTTRSVEPSIPAQSQMNYLPLEHKQHARLCHLSQIK